VRIREGEQELVLPPDPLRYQELLRAFARYAYEDDLRMHGFQLTKQRK
jgi:hypothetical protein